MTSRLFDVVIGLFGYGRAVLGEWPHGEIVAAAIAMIEERGGVAYEESGTPAGEVENIRFRLRGSSVRLCVVDYGEVTLWGPRKLVMELAAQIAERLRAGGHEAHSSM